MLKWIVIDTKTGEVEAGGEVKEARYSSDTSYLMYGDSKFPFPLPAHHSLHVYFERESSCRFPKLASEEERW